MSARSGRLTQFAARVVQWRGWLGAPAAGRLPMALRRIEPALYALFAGACVLWVSTRFTGSMRDQVSLLIAMLGDDPAASRLRAMGAWSMPLDDVFIHFDFARATARSYPFEWSEGNGYSSGGTSLLYPLLLALGYLIGFRELWLGLWATALASVSVFGLLLAARRIFATLPRPVAYLAPPVLLSIGALDWNLFSGMEVALFLGLWGGALVAWDDLVGEPGPGSVGTAFRLGLWGALLVATRPEGATSVGVLAVAAALVRSRRPGHARPISVACLAALPGALVVIGQEIVNYWLTGESSSAGAVAKLEVFDPYLAPSAVWDAYKFHVEYQIRRITEYHLAADPWVGWLWWGLALVPLLVRSTRRYALLLWAHAVAWVLLVGLNGQVRWQNERYAMPALAWLLLAAALGLGVLLSFPRTGTARRLGVRVASLACGLVLVAVLSYEARPRFIDQVWFYGRASRNILEQHVRTGLLLGDHRSAARAGLVDEQPLAWPRRVLVGDAGAIPYAADLPALDLIGLGGYRGLPWARAKRAGIPAALELLERVVPEERPDVLAIYPSWWDALPLWFGERLTEVPVHGNVICGGASKVIYRADWSPLDSSPVPSGLLGAERPVDAVDFADLISERAHRLRLSVPRAGHLEMKILPHPLDGARSLWDAGRIVAPGQAMSFDLEGLDPTLPARLLLRVAPEQPSRLRVFLGQRALGIVTLAAGDEWQYVPMPLVLERVSATLSVRIEVELNPVVLYHLWVVQTH